jgi:hypothetical protein
MPPVMNLDLPGIFMAAQRARQMQQQEELQQQQIERERLLPEARQYAMPIEQGGLGRTDLLSMIAPQEVAQQQQAQFQAQMQPIQIETAQAQLAAMKEPKQEPFGLELFKNLQPYERAAVPKFVEPTKLRAKLLTDQKFMNEAEKIRLKWISEKEREAAKGASRISNVVGGSNLAPPVKADLQQRSIMRQKVVKNIAELQKIDREQFENYTKLRTLGASWASQAGIEWKEGQRLLKERQALITRGRLNALRILNTESGKQLTDREREFVIDAVGNPEKHSYEEYQSSLDTLNEIMAMEQEIDIETLGAHGVTKRGAKLPTGGISDEDLGKMLGY